jgi:hypothetical protein
VHTGLFAAGSPVVDVPYCKRCISDLEIANFVIKKLTFSPAASIPCRKGSTRTGGKYDEATDSGVSIRVRVGWLISDGFTVGCSFGLFEVPVQVYQEPLTPLCSGLAAIQMRNSLDFTALRA